MAAGEAVVPAAMMTKAMVDYFNASNFPIAAPEPRPFLQIMAATNRARHPSGSSDQHCSAIALAVLPPQKNVGAAPRPMGSSQTRGCRFPGANPWLAHVAGDPLLLQIGDGEPASHSDQMAVAPVP
jgi:hypothetical protein